MAKRRSRLKATIAGAITGLALAAGGFLAAMALQEAASHNAVSNEVPVWARILVFAPGVIGFGAIFAFPISALMVFTIVALSRRSAVFDTAIAWLVAGLLFATPVAWLFSGMLENGRMSLFSVWSYGLIVGALSGLVAWRFRHINELETPHP